MTKLIDNIKYKAKEFLHKNGLFGYEKVISIYCKYCGYEGCVGVTPWITNEETVTRCSNCKKMSKLHELFSPFKTVEIKVISRK